MIKCPCCLSELKVTHQDRYETLIEHVECTEPTIKDGYQCPNESCKAHEMNAVWIEDGDFWIKEPPTGLNYTEAKNEVEKCSLSGRLNAVDSFSDGYEAYKADQEKRKMTLNLYWFIFQFTPRYERVEGSNYWERTGSWKRTIMVRKDGRYLHFMTFWDIYYYELGNYNSNIHGALSGNQHSIDVILKLANNEDMFGRKEKRFWWRLAAYFVCWVWNKERTKIVVNSNINRKTT